MKHTDVLKRNEDFIKILKKGNWFSGNLITVYLVKTDKDFNRIGIAVSKKFSKSSVKRNRVRRLIKEVYRINEPFVAYGYDILFLLKNQSDYSEISFDSIQKDFLKSMKKAGLLDNREDENA